MAAVVITERLVETQDQFGRGQISDVWVGADAVALDPGIPAGVRIVHEEIAVGGILRVERHAQQPLLSSAAHLAHDIQKRGSDELAVLHNANAAGLFYYE